MSEPTIKTPAVVPGPTPPASPKVNPDGRDFFYSQEAVTMTDEQPLGKTLLALIIPIAICVGLGALVWWQLLNDFSQSP